MALAPAAQRIAQLERALSDLLTAFHPRLPEDRVLLERAKALLNEEPGWVKRFVWEGLKDGLARLDAAKNQARER